jgi:hypothetical protein
MFKINKFCPQKDEKPTLKSCSEFLKSTFFSLLPWLSKRPQQKNSCSKMWPIDQLYIELGIFYVIKAIWQKFVGYILYSTRYMRWLDNNSIKKSSRTMLSPTNISKLSLDDSSSFVLAQFMTSSLSLQYLIFFSTSVQCLIWATPWIVPNDTGCFHQCITSSWLWVIRMWHILEGQPPWPAIVEDLVWTPAQLHVIGGVAHSLCHSIALIGSFLSGKIPTISRVFPLHLRT